MDVVSWVVPDLIEFGRLRRPTFGAEFANAQIAYRLGIRQGALVLDVNQDSAAEKAGIRATRRDRRGRILLGDIVVAINDEPIVSAGDVLLVLEKLRPGQRITVTLARPEGAVDVSVVLDAWN